MSPCPFTIVPKVVEFLNDVNTIIFKFLWAGKSDQISRSIIMLQPFQGGMNISNIFNFKKALKYVSKAF